MPENVQAVIAWNPVDHYIAFFRSLILHGAILAAGEWGICIGTSLIAFVLGFATFRKLQRNFILYIRESGI